MLCSCGKVCLSLLGTWDGQQGEQWNETTSTILQVGCGSDIIYNYRFALPNAVKTTLKCIFHLIPACWTLLNESHVIYQGNCCSSQRVPVLNSATFSRLFFSAWPGSGAPLSRDLEGVLNKFCLID